MGWRFFTITFFSEIFQFYSESEKFKIKKIVKTLDSLSVTLCFNEFFTKIWREMLSSVNFLEVFVSKNSSNSRQTTMRPCTKPDQLTTDRRPHYILFSVRRITCHFAKVHRKQVKPYEGFSVIWKIECHSNLPENGFLLRVLIYKNNFY